ncbi:MAG: indole-3-glycerol phosphate synthase TrpC [Syntrophorhabdaceae bacterium]|nr:indole-3-glycerol phosphate synthase TrpC [Syntrophorhabdaceae bacterium]
MTFLERIVFEKKEKVKFLKSTVPISELEMKGRDKEKRAFFEVFSRREKTEVKIIGEVKRASPSKGVLVEDLDLIRLVDAYIRGGVRAISIITEERYFMGSLGYLEEVKRLTGLPVLRKDFIVDEYEIIESKASGADAILLIGEALEREQIRRFLNIAREIDVDVLLEIHGIETFKKVSDMEGYILGINSRDLHTMEVDMDIPKRLLKEIPDDMPVVVESGIKTRGDIEGFMGYGVSGFLIGTTLMTSVDPAEKIRELKGDYR